MSSHEMPARPAKPEPTPNPETRVFWDGLATGVLRIQRCRRCGVPQHHARVICRWCWSAELDWVEAEGRGQVWTWTVVHRAGHPAWDDEVPYAVLIVELDEGPRLVSTYDGDLGRLTVGLTVRLGARPQGDGHVVVAREVGP